MKVKAIVKEINYGTIEVDVTENADVYQVLTAAYGEGMMELDHRIDFEIVSVVKVNPDGSEESV